MIRSLDSYLNTASACWRNSLHLVVFDDDTSGLEAYWMAEAMAVKAPTTSVLAFDARSVHASPELLWAAVSARGADGVPFLGALNQWHPEDQARLLQHLADTERISPAPLVAHITPKGYFNPGLKAYLLSRCAAAYPEPLLDRPGDIQAIFVRCLRAQLAHMRPLPETVPAVVQLSRPTVDCLARYDWSTSPGAPSLARYVQRLAQETAEKYVGDHARAQAWSGQLDLATASAKHVWWLPPTQSRDWGATNLGPPAAAFAKQPIPLNPAFAIPPSCIEPRHLPPHIAANPHGDDWLVYAASLALSPQELVDRYILFCHRHCDLSIPKMTSVLKANTRLVVRWLRGARERKDIGQAIEHLPPTTRERTTKLTDRKRPVE